MQRNENFFFCVSSRSGDIIPNTEVVPGTSRFISESVCKQYSALCKSNLGFYVNGGFDKFTKSENLLFNPTLFNRFCL